MAAWKDTRLPIVGKHLTEVQGKLWWKHDGQLFTSLNRSTGSRIDGMDEEKNEGGIHGRDYRISLTIGVLCLGTKTSDRTTHLLVDPSSCEEPFLKGIITIVVSLSTGKMMFDYTGKVALTAKDMALASKLAESRKKEVASIFL